MVLKKMEGLIALMYLLRRHRRLRARDIGQELGVSEQTVYRDIAALNEAFQDYLRIVFIGEEEEVLAPHMRNARSNPSDC